MIESDGTESMRPLADAAAVPAGIVEEIQRRQAQSGTQYPSSVDLPKVRGQRSNGS